jgi:hypothetical protein
MEIIREAKCAGCGQTKACHTAEYGKAYNGKEVALISNALRQGSWESRVTISMCDDCIGEKPRNVRAFKPWLWVLLAFSFLSVSYGIYDIQIHFSSPDMPIGFPIIIVGVILGWIGSAAGLSHLWKFNAAFLTGFLLGWTPIPAFIMLFSLKKANKNAWVNNRLGEKANVTFNEGQKMLSDLQKKDPDTISDEEKKLLKDEKVRRDVAEAAAASEKKSLNGKSAGRAALGIVFTIAIAIWGISTFSHGDYMTWLGIKLSPAGFALLIAAFLIYDIVTIVSATKEKKG